MRKKPDNLKRRYITVEVMVFVPKDTTITKEEQEQDIQSRLESFSWGPNYAIAEVTVTED